MTDPGAYRDPRNGSEVEAALLDIVGSCDELVARLKRLDELLSPDLELTPDQSDGLAETLGAVGMLGAVILQTDLARTIRREGGLPASSKDRGSHGVH